jgi:predicted ribosome quality control (RQC) complex YloA/Tae2 family protein
MQILNMKDRFNIIDTYAIIKELQHFNSYRVNNIYDIDNKTFLIKFDDFDQKRKCFIIIKSGQYLYHIYNPSQERRKLPSSFCMKLRKHIKNKRLQSIEMLKSDRVIQFTFGTSKHQYKLIIELFSFGNIILCDKEDTMLALLRTHVYENGNTIMVNHKYPVQQLNDEFNQLNIKEEIEQINTTTCSYKKEKEVSPLPIKNYTTTLPTFNDALNSYIKINVFTPTIIKNKKIKRSAEDSIRIHAKQKIKKLHENIKNLNIQIEWMYQNETVVKELLKSLSVIDKEHHIMFVHENEHERKNYKFVKTLNYHQNINHLYGLIKKLTEKINKTELGSENAILKLKNVQTKYNKKQKEIAKMKSNKITLSMDRWYQEYHWFYTSHNYLVICGKNSTQSETIVKKHMNSTDIYFHSEVSGSGSAILINPDNKEIQPVDIEEVGSFVICYSNAWKDKTPDYAYWVKPDQVSKTTQSGEFVQNGAFIIRGKKNYIYRTQLELGCTIVKNRFMIAPYKCIQKMDKNNIKITPGTQKRKKSLEIIIKKLQIDNKTYDFVDSKIPYGIKINYK